MGGSGLKKKVGESKGSSCQVIKSVQDPCRGGHTMAMAAIVFEGNHGAFKGAKAFIYVLASFSVQPPNYNNG